MKVAICILAFVAAASAGILRIDNENALVERLLGITMKTTLSTYKAHTQEFEADKCAGALSDDTLWKGPSSYYIWSEKQKDNKNALAYGCTCKETVDITTTLTKTKTLDIGTDFPHVWRAFCEGKEDPIQDDGKLQALLTEFKKHGAEHVLELLKWGEELVRGYLKNLALDNADWGFTFVLNQIETRLEDEALVSAMEFCYVTNIKKEVYTKLASDQKNNHNEQRFIRYFVDTAREDKELVAYLKAAEDKVAVLINNAAALFMWENSADEEHFKKEVDKFMKAFFGADRLSIDHVNAALAKYCKQRFDDDESIKQYAAEDKAALLELGKTNADVWC